jgi:hypothetical protein
MTFLWVLFLRFFRIKLFRNAVAVIFEKRDAALFLVLKNVSKYPVTDVALKFNHPIKGSGGIDVTQLELLKNIAFLGAGQSIELLLDNHSSFFQNNTAPDVEVLVQYKDRNGLCYGETNRHSLSIYKHLGTINFNYKK